jgi:adenylylsulfate kinase-like enzyme
MTTFTQEDQAMLDDLTFRKAMVDWSAREDDRQRKLAALSEVAKVFTSATIAPIVECASTQRAAMESVDPAFAEMLGNVRTVVGYSGMQIVQLIDRLSTPEPEPAVATVAAA